MRLLGVLGRGWVCEMGALCGSCSLEVERGIWRRLVGFEGISWIVSDGAWEWGESYFAAFTRLLCYQIAGTASLGRLQSARLNLA